jgi:hypothetical protein
MMEFDIMVDFNYESEVSNVILHPPARLLIKALFVDVAQSLARHRLLKVLSLLKETGSLELSSKLTLVMVRAANGGASRYI